MSLLAVIQTEFEPSDLQHLTSIDVESSWIEVIARLFGTAILAAMLGWDRETKNRAAGLRTHMLVGVGAAIFTLVGVEFFELTATVSSHARIDPLRVVAGVISGVGFLGAGAIIQSGGKVKGLTTAASLWVTAAIGMAVGTGFYVLAAAGTVISFITLTLVRRFEEIANNGQSSTEDDGREDS